MIRSICYAPQSPYLSFNPMDYIGPRRKFIKAAAKAYASVPVDSWMSLPAFISWHSESVNPLISAVEGICDAPLPFWCEELSRKESNWKSVLESFLFDRLIPLGGAKTGYDNEGNPLFSINQMGAYIIGATDEFSCSLQDESAGIIVQPNFEIIFTMANPIAESEIIQYAERIGKQVGVLFRITRDSIMNALDNEMSYAQIVENLRELSTVELPKNLVTQIESWGESYRVARFETIKVINCPDAETAMHIHSLLPRDTEIISETIVKVETKKSLNTLKKQLKANGIGLLG